MTRSLRFTPLAAALAAVLTAQSASAIAIVEVFPEADVAGGIANSFLDTVAVSGGVAYAVSRDTSGADVGAVVSFDGSTFTTISDTADWLATGSSNDLAASNGAGVVGNALRFVNFFDNAVYEIDLGTGAATEVVSALAIAATTGTAPSLIAAYETAPSGQIYTYDSTAANRQVISISPTNVVSIEVSPANFATAVGTSLGGVGIAGDTLYLGSNTNDELVAWNTVTDTASVVLDTATIDNLTDDVDGRVGFGDIFAAPDGLVYFYESDADYIMSFDPADPAGTLAVVATEAQLLAGPSSDLLGQFAWWDGALAFTDQSDGFYSVIPEPASALLAAIAGIGFVRRRR